ncbi:histidine kinase [Primorskyibacter flagellatus]|uniref:histidine kinase n=1 Tax=Primorskyibacter flagellatus TaxID=1387277 RepID=A0A916ZVX8_9RHOB|nr:hybrid sensor histidine kinase/response regulator [Primorskyibacter flagellatus]GGE16445.1 histidine kinase [Primorskyibacter flagellatus]
MNVAISADPGAKLQTGGPAVAIFAPHGRDAQMAARLFSEQGIPSSIAGDLDSLLRQMTTDLGAVLLTEETLDSHNADSLHEALAQQPAWSDLPFIVLAVGTERTRSDTARKRIDALGNVVLLTRPMHAEELLRAVKSALKARRRQFEARDRMEELLLREKQLRESEAKFHTIANSVDQMIWSTLPDGFHDYYNARWYEYTGVPEGSTDGEAWNGMFHPEDQERAWSVWRHSLATGEPYEIEYRLRHRSGEYRWVLGRAKAVRDDAGRIIRWYGSCTDIHDDVMAREAAVDDLTRQRDQAWNLSLDLMAVTSRSGSMEILNQSWNSLLDWDVDELRGRRFARLVHPEDLPTAKAAFRHVMEAPVTEPVEFRIRHSDGSYRWFAWTASGHEDRIFATGRDVTERREKDAALANAEAALRQSQKLDMIGQLTGGVAHDFNNLLAAIRSSLELARRRIPPGAEVSRYLGNAIAAADRGAGLTQRMLAFARKQELHFDAVEIQHLLPDLRDLLQRSLGPQIDMIFDIPDDLPSVLVDTNQLEMAILNLSVNGRDAMDGSGRLTFSARQVADSGGSDLEAGDYVVLSIADTGCGMDANTLERAFEPFFTTKGVGKGTGLGLSMVHGLAAQSGGAFRMESTLGKGTTAHLYLPIIEQSADTAAPDARNPGPAHARGNDRKLTILTVDDDLLVSMGTVGMLEDMGHDVLEASSGAQALDIFAQRDDIDLVITDQAMPRMTGVELARTLREKRPDLPIILATGYADLPEGASGEVTAKLDKPFSEDGLKSVIRSVTETLAVPGA